GAAELVAVEILRAHIDACAGQRTHESASEAVTGARRIENIFEHITGHHEVLVAMPKNRAVLAPLDDENLRTHADDLRRGFAQIVFAGEHASFRIIDEQE